MEKIQVDKELAEMQEKHVFFSLKNSAQKKVEAYKKIVLFVNIPILVSIPLATNFNLVPFAIPAAKTQLVYMLLHGMDVFLFMNSILLWSVISKIVKEIAYCPESKKLTISQYSGWFLKERSVEINPDEIKKHKRKSLNPIVGYQSLAKCDYDLSLGTEGGVGDWDNQLLFDSMIAPPVAKKTLFKKREKNQDKSSGKEQDIFGKDWQ